ncbi:MAG: 5-formyltetrahydrofolate cyclo-ligase [Alphaproteobacteria bacterium]
MMTASLQAEKRRLRSAAKERRNALSVPFRKTASAAVCRNVISVLSSRMPTCLSAFIAIQSEVDPAAILDWAHTQAVATALPVTSDAVEMVFRRHRPGDALTTGAFGTRTPEETAPLVKPDTLVVPLLAFDRMGCRLGYGAGYYYRAIDRLARDGRRPFLLGVAFSVQEVQHVPSEPHDALMDAVATEQGVVYCGADG